MALSERVRVGIKAIRWLTFIVAVWLLVEGARVYYFHADMERFMQLADYVLKAWFPMFITAAGGSHFKRWTEAMKLKQENGKEPGGE